MISGLRLFPGGANGAGLLLLRLSVATSLLLLSIQHLGDANVLQFLAFLAAIGLCAGFQTRIAAAVGLLIPIVRLVSGGDLSSLAIVNALNAVALVLTGPGAWSADALLFGRQTVTLPDRNDTIV